MIMDHFRLCTESVDNSGSPHPGSQKKEESRNKNDVVDANPREEERECVKLALSWVGETRKSARVSDLW